MSNKVQSFGKIRYIEPNDIPVNNMYSGDYDGSLNITHQYEDYSISVDLIVTIPNRLGSASNKNKNINVSLNDMNNGSISFFSGDEEFLTDRANSFTYHDILNNKSTRESLGITNINISYNSYLYPEVTINFSDIRGSSLMMPNEENYRRDEINRENNGTYKTKVENFFSALFSFPYPEFKLQVKGFYGKKVEYSLIVSDFKSSFNNTTGNFDATVKFIGKMFGVYTDIPMSYLLISPYCRYGGSNNLTIWDECNFKFSDGIKIPTFIELKDKVITANHEIKTRLSEDTVTEYNKTHGYLELLQKINNAYHDLINYITLQKNEDFFENNGIIICKIKDNNCDYLYNNYNLLHSKIGSLTNLIIDFNDNSSIKLPFLSSLEKPDNKIGTDNNFKITVSKINNKLNIDYKSQKIKSSDRNIILTIFNDYVNIENNTISEYYIVSSNGIEEKIRNSIKEYKDDEENLEKKANDNFNLVTRELLGFEPTIKNIFTILMAHLDAFTKIYSRFLKNVTDVSSRKISDYGFSYGNTSDIPIDMLDIPPFAAFKNSEGEFCYPNLKIVNKIMEETRLIDSLFESTFKFTDKLNEVDKKDDFYNDTSLDFIPTCLTDISNLYYNPYKSVFKLNNSTINMDWILTYFGIRCIMKFMFEQNNNLSYESFGKCEAYNFWRVNKLLNQSIIDNIKNSNFNSNLFVNFLLGNDCYLLSDNKIPCYSNNESTKKLLERDVRSGKLVLSNSFNFPAIVGRDGDDFNTFFNDIDNVNGAYSFISGSTNGNRPYVLINYVDDSNLVNWNSLLSSTDISKYCNDDEKKTLLENYIKMDQNIYGTGIESSSREKNVFFSKKKSDFFFNSFTENKKYIDHLELLTLRTYFNGDCSEGKLDSIESNSTPIFFSENLTAEKFLMSIPHNLIKLSNDIINGRKIITIPYSTELLIGMIIDKLKNNSNSSVNFYSEYENIGGKFYDIQYFGKIITFLTRDNSGLFNESISNNIEKYLQEHDNVINPTAHTNNVVAYIFYENNGTKLKENFNNDYLGLREKYLEWKNSTKPGGFKYFVDKYTLYETEEMNGIEGETLKERLVNLCYSKIKTKSSSDNDTNKKILNSSFRSFIDNTKTAFTDRYSSIFYIQNQGKDDIVKRRKDNVIHLTFNEEFSAFKHLEDFFKKTVKLVLPYKMTPYDDTTNGRPTVDVTMFHSAFNSFKNTLISLYEDKSNVNEQEYNNDIDVSEDNKLAMYRTLKNLYDKHFYDLTSKEDVYDITKKDSELDRFHFVDTFYNDLSESLIINLETLTELLDVITNGYEDGDGKGDLTSEMSLYSFMSLICEKHHMLFMSLPVFNGTFTTNEGVDNFSTMFTPIPYNKSVNEHVMNGPTHVCFYPHQASQHLDIEKSQYRNDGFNIPDLNDTANFGGPSQIPDLQHLDENNNYVIPAFAVEYGSQKQSIFKNININMDNPQTTEVAVATMFKLANSNNEDMQKIRFEGQDLFKIYSNYSYTCQVEMMGCAQIMPLMYFQLNNIPLFRGAYQIIQVEHNVTPGDMTTSFKGIRINSTKIPMVKETISLTNMRQILNGNNNKIKNNIPMNIQSIEANMEVMNLDKQVDDTMLLRDYPKHIKFDDGQKTAFNRLNPALKKLVYCIVRKLPELSEKLGYTIGIAITSSTRDATVNGNGGSDHLINGNPSKRRMALVGTNHEGEEVSYATMGCAVDMVGTKNGQKDYGEASINIFDFIAKKCHKYIRQLIWEVKNQGTSENRITLIHLASYGEVGPNGSDKNEIFVAEYPEYSGRQTGNNNLPSEFLKILCSLEENKNENGNNVCFNNFTEKPSLDVLKKKYKTSLMNA